MSRPNILWISTEDTSPRHGCFGDPLKLTPNLDRLAAEGVRFPNAFCPAPVCAPTRGGLITGYHATAMGGQYMRTNTVVPYGGGAPTPYQAVPPAYVKMLPEYLRAAGYYCTNNGKTDYQFESPVAAWDANGHPHHLLDIHWRNRPDPSQPFFCVFNLVDTHESRMWPGQGQVVEPEMERVPEVDPDSVPVPPYLPDTREVRITIARHYRNLAHNDRLAGILLRQLEEDGLADNTIVMHWSDHGEGQPRAKRFLYDSGVRVPLIIRAPGRLGAPGSVDERMASLIDLAPTVLEAAGLPLPQHLAGTSLLATAETAPKYVHGYRERMDIDYDKARSVRSRDFKYIRNYYPGMERYGYTPYRAQHESMQAIRQEQLRGNNAFDQPAAPEELFDLRVDPFELNNLAAAPEHQETLREMRAELARWQALHDPDVATPENHLAERLWPGRQQPPTFDPIAIAFHEGNLQGEEITSAETTIQGPVLLQLHCSTEGATIGYRLGAAEEAPLKPYRTLLRLEAGRHELVIQAQRIGYARSEQKRFVFQIS